MSKPIIKPKNPRFSPGPAKKYPSFSSQALKDELLGRSHRSSESTELFQSLITKIRSLFQIPQEYKILITPGSDTGALELATWNLLGIIPVDCLCWDHFGYMWQHNLEHELKLNNLESFSAPYGKYPETKNVDFANHDVVFTLCGTTSGTIFNEFDRIPLDRKGLIITDATSFVLSKKIDWQKIDVLTFSWQKCLGGEAQHGILVLSPRAVKRLEDFTPQRTMPQLYRIKNYDNTVKYDLLEGSPINTPSLLCIIDFINALDWAEQQGGLDFCIKRGQNNFEVIKSWVEKSTWIDFLTEDITKQSPFALCLKIIDTKYLSLTEKDKEFFLNKLLSYLNKNEIAYDINSYKKSPLGIRLWGGPTIDSEDIKILTEWLDYCFSSLINTREIA